jgi:GMP synthase (glutamine-hydrolysing)
MVQTLTRVTAETLAEIAEEKRVRKTDELFLLFSMGSQFDHLIKQALDQLGVFCLVADPVSVTAEDVKKVAPTGIILSGGPASVHAEPPPFDNLIFDLGIPVLGVCLGFQMWAKHIGIPVVLGAKREFGTHLFTITKPDSPLLENIPSPTPVMESHGDIIVADDKLQILGHTDNAPVSAGRYKHLWGIQFHPEVTETEYGPQIYENFVFKICGAKDRFPAAEVAQKKVAELEKQIAGKKIVLALSGGSDSAVVAYLLKHAVAEKPGYIRGVYIKGIDRPDDETNVHEYFGSQPWLELKIVDATPQFLTALAGQHAMRDKRLAMRGVYKEVLEAEAKNFGADFIAQGTLYTDISESGGGYASGARKAQIKIHHNVNLEFSVPELAPLADSVKDSGRNIGRSLGVPEKLLVRHPFPGPGLIVRIEGEVTAEKLKTARAIDGIYIEELRNWNLYDTVWQAGAVVTASNTTATKGDDAAEGHVIALWAVWSVNGFTARAAELPYDFLKAVSRRMTNEIREVGAVVYRTSDKPPVTIEWG